MIGLPFIVMNSFIGFSLYYGFAHHQVNMLTGYYHQSMVFFWADFRFIVTVLCMSHESVCLNWSIEVMICRVSAFVNESSSLLGPCVVNLVTIDHYL